MARRKRENDESAPIEKSWRAAIYLRLSVEDGDDVEQNSIGNQKKICLDHLAKKDDIEIVEFYSDNGYSGMNYRRPGFSGMYADIESGRINCIVVKDTSRFGREYITTSEFLQRTFPELDIRFISVNDDYDSIDPDRTQTGF